MKSISEHIRIIHPVCAVDHGHLEPKAAVEQIAAHIDPILKAAAELRACFAIGNSSTYLMTGADLNQAVKAFDSAVANAGIGS